MAYNEREGEWDAVLRSFWLRAKVGGGMKLPAKMCDQGVGEEGIIVGATLLYCRL